jgi:glutamate synthase (NADPH/NADH) large chain
MVALDRLAAGAGEAFDDTAPRPEALSVWDSGMGDPLRFDAARLRILLERHHRRTGSARAAALLADWERALGMFVKVTPHDYRRALLAAAAPILHAVAAE